MKLRNFLSTLACGALLFGMSCSANAARSDPSVTLEQARQALQDPANIVIDIREPDEHATGVAPGMRLIPMSQLGQRLGELPEPGAQPVLLICNTQARSSRVAAQLRAAGYSNVRFVNGGMSQWSARGWPLVKPAK